MSLDKAIISGKEHRKPYKGAKATVRSCRNHGRCCYCRYGRLHNTKKAIRKAQESMKDGLY